MCIYLSLVSCQDGNTRIVIYKLWSGFRVDPASLDNDETGSIVIVILMYVFVNFDQFLG